ncbi:unnamed protein product [Natator depressus]
METLRISHFGGRGAKISNWPFVDALLSALQLPSAIAIVKCSAHQKPYDDVTRGNALADATARQVALSGSPAPFDFIFFSSQFPSMPASLHDLALMQDLSPEPEKDRWRRDGCTLHPDALWRSPDGRLVAPKAVLPYLARASHGLAHVSKGGMIASVLRHWYAPNFSIMAQQYCNFCPTCLAHNSSRPVRTKPAAHPTPWGPFVNIQINFINMPKCSYEYVLVCVCMYSGWIEAYPCAKADSPTVAKKSLRDFIPRFGLPLSSNSDQGTHFTGQIMQQICKALNITQHLHCAHHSQSVGAVERKNGELKNKISKICAETSLKWPDALPLVHEEHTYMQTWPVPI